MITDDKRIRIMVGHYGSGKSEFAINYAVNLRKHTSDKIALSDLDVVNVYFRSREQESMLRDLDIHTIHSSVNTPALDLPSISGEIATPINDKNCNYIMDVGGDSIGARVLGRFSNSIVNNEYDMFFVINANREQTQNVDQVIEHIKEIEKASKLKVTGLINNTHLIRNTTVQDIVKGQDLSAQVSKQLNIPIKYTSCIENIISELPESIEGYIIPIKLYMRQQWM